MEDDCDHFFLPADVEYRHNQLLRVTSVYCARCTWIKDL